MLHFSYLLIDMLCINSVNSTVAKKKDENLNSDEEVWKANNQQQNIGNYISQDNIVTLLYI